MPEPMKSELLAANDVVEMKRLGSGKVAWANKANREMGKLTLADAFFFRLYPSLIFF